MRGINLRRRVLHRSADDHDDIDHNLDYYNHDSRANDDNDFNDSRTDHHDIDDSRTDNHDVYNT